MPNDKKLPATVPTNSTLPQVESDGLVARGLFAVRQSLAVPEKEDAESRRGQGRRLMELLLAEALRLAHRALELDPRFGLASVRLVAALAQL